MATPRGLSPVMRFIAGGAGLVILLGGMKLASSLLAPIIFTVFVVILCIPIMRWLQRKGLPTCSRHRCRRSHVTFSGMCMGASPILPIRPVSCMVSRPKRTQCRPAMPEHHPWAVT